MASAEHNAVILYHPRSSFDGNPPHMYNIWRPSSYANSNASQKQLHIFLRGQRKMVFHLSTHRTCAPTSYIIVTILRDFGKQAPINIRRLIAGKDIMRLTHGNKLHARFSPSSCVYHYFHFFFPPPVYTYTTNARVYPFEYLYVILFFVLFRFVFIYY